MDNIEKIKIDESVQRVADAISSYVELDEKQNVKLDEWTVSDVEIAMKKKYGKVDKEAIAKLKKVQYRGNVDRNDLVKAGHGKLDVGGLIEEVEIDEKFTKKDFDKNEDRNLHSENAVELARKFGSKKEYDRMVAIYKSHMKRGSISSSEQKERDALIIKYQPKLEAVMRKETILERTDKKLKERKNG